MQMDFLASSVSFDFSAEQVPTCSLSWVDTTCGPSLGVPPCGELPGDQVCASSSSGHRLPFMDGALHSSGHTWLHLRAPRHRGPGAQPTW